MSNVIDSFLVALGFQVDEKSAKESEKAIDDIRSNALAMGAALSTAFVGAGFAAKQTAAEITELYNTSKTLSSVGVEGLDKWGHAFKQAGGSVEDAASTIGSLEEAIAKAQLKGEAAFEDLQIAGIDPSFIMDASNAIDLLERLLEIYPKLSPQQQQVAQGALGLSRGADLLLREGSDQVQQWLEDAENFGAVTDEMGEKSQELTRALNDVGRAWDDLMNRFTSGSSEGLTKAAEDFSEALNKLDGSADILGSLYGDALPFLAPAATVGTAAGGAGILGTAASAVGMTGAGGTLTAAGGALATGVALPLAVGGGLIWAGKVLHEKLNWEGVNTSPTLDQMSFSLDQISPPSSKKVQAVDQSRHIGHMEVHVHEANSKTGEDILREVDSAAEMAEQSLRTGLEG